MLCVARGGGDTAAVMYTSRVCQGDNLIEQLAAQADLNLLQLCRRELGQQATGVRGTLALHAA